MVTLLLTLMAVGQTPPLARTSSEQVALRVRAYAEGRLATPLLPRALKVAEDLLRAAGLNLTWRTCGAAEPCLPEAHLVPEVVVILSSRKRPDPQRDCGLAALGARVGEGTAIVSVPCVVEIVSALSRRLSTRDNPLLAVPRYDDLVGAVVAHEIGHLLGVGHARIGIMRGRMEVEDIVALRLGRLRFSEPESARMRVAVSIATRSDAAPRTARRER